MLGITATIISLNLVLLLSGYGKSNPADSHFSQSGGSTKGCGKFEVKCEDGQCIPADFHCDGHVDCQDKSDETREACSTTTCSSYTFRCAYGACVDKDSTCNGIKNCADNSDETLPICLRNSSNFDECRSYQFQCTSGQCIDKTSLCDGTADCSDKSDETATVCSSFPCVPYGFRCVYGGCIDGDLKCNRIINCADGSDEDQSLCARGTTQRSKISSRPTNYQLNTPRLTTRSTSRASRKVTCPVPLQPLNGQYKLHKSYCPYREHCNVNPEVYSLEKGTQLIYSCNSGFKIIGNKDVFCGPEGKWLHIPECIDLYNFILKELTRHQNAVLSTLEEMNNKN